MPLQNFASKILKLSGKIFAKIIFLVFRRMMVLGKNLHTEIISGVSLIPELSHLSRPRLCGTAGTVFLVL